MKNGVFVSFSVISFPKKCVQDFEVHGKFSMYVDQGEFLSPNSKSNHNPGPKL